MRALGASRTSLVPGGALAGGWTRNPLWKTARAVPSLDLRFADNKTLGDAVDGGSLVTFTRASTGTYVGSDALIQTAATNEPRFDHNPTTGESLGLLVEEARTNLLLNSATLSTQSVTVAAAANTLSFYGTGTVTLTGVSTAGPLVGTGANNRVSLTFTPTVGVLVLTVSGSVTNAQLEAGAFATSYIPTVASTVTRAADVASITGSNFSSWYNHSEGTMAVTASIRGGNTVVSSGLAIVNGIAKLAESAATANARGFTFNTSVSPNGYRFAQRSSITNITINDTSYETIQFGKHYTYGGSYVNNSTQGLALSVDGRTVITNATAVDVPVPTRLLIGAGSTGANAGVGIDEYYLNGTIKRLTYWPTRLANTTLQQITQP
jgi:hypothetical protein